MIAIKSGHKIFFAELVGYAGYNFNIGFRKQERGSNYNYAADELTALENVDSQLDSYYADLSRQQQVNQLLHVEN